MLPKWSIQILGGLVGFALLLTYSLYSPETRTREQIEFSNWFSTLKTQGRTISDATNPASAVHVKISSSIATIPLNYELVEHSEGPLDDRVFRVLNLIDEAQFQLSQAPPSVAPDGKLLIRVTSAEGTFGTILDEGDIRQNLKIMNLLKIFEIYSLSPSSTPVDSNSKTNIAAPTPEAEPNL